MAALAEKRRFVLLLSFFPIGNSTNFPIPLFESWGSWNSVVPHKQQNHCVFTGEIFELKRWSQLTLEILWSDILGPRGEIYPNNSTSIQDLKNGNCEGIDEIWSHYEIWLWKNRIWSCSRGRGGHLTDCIFYT